MLKHDTLSNPRISTLVSDEYNINLHITNSNVDVDIENSDNIIKRLFQYLFEMYFKYRINAPHD